MASRIEEETLALRQSSLSQEMMAVQSRVEQVVTMVRLWICFEGRINRIPSNSGQWGTELWGETGHWVSSWLWGGVWISSWALCEATPEYKQMSSQSSILQASLWRKGGKGEESGGCWGWGGHVSSLYVLSAHTWRTQTNSCWIMNSTPTCSIQ